MGGLILYDNGYPKEVLDYRCLTELLQKKQINASTVTEHDLQDRSKGEAVSKAVVMVQTMWFVLQCFARWVQHLPLSEPKVITLAFAVMNAAICIPLKRTEKGVEDVTASLTGAEAHERLSHPEPASPHVDHRHSCIPNDRPDILPHEKQPDTYTGEKHSWLRRRILKDREKYNSPFFFLFRLPYRIVGSVLRLLGKMGSADAFKFESKDLRLPMFYVSHVGSHGTVLASCVIGTVFGAIHLLAWTSKFPSHRDLILWRASATVLNVAPFLIPSAFAVDTLGMGPLAVFLTWLLLPLTPLYIVARFVLIVIALKAICDPFHDVLRETSWTSYLPHF